MFRADEFYSKLHDWARCQITVYDVRDGEALTRFWSERAAWAEYAHVEALDECRYLLIVWPGSAREKAA